MMLGLPSPGDLITLESVKAWLNADGTTSFPTGSDAILANLITSVSRFAGSYLQRNLQPSNYTDVYNGTDTDALTLRNSPIISVTSVTIGTLVIPPRATPVSTGFVADLTTLYVRGYRFWRGAQNISVSYRAGYQQTDTTAVPASGPLSVDSLGRPWNSDQGVAYASSGVAFTKVTSAPAVGQYMVQPDANGTAEYVFNTSDANAAISLTYGYTPEDVAQALVELVGEAYKRRGRIGENSVNIGKGQVVSFNKADMNESARSMLQPWRIVVPIQ